jgi:MYXO-CTERM domain-containing protein
MPRGVGDMAVGGSVPSSPEPELFALVGVAGALAAWARRRKAKRRES